MAQTREHSRHLQIGHIMFEGGGNKRSASRSQAGTQVYCMENKQPDKQPKVYGTSRAGSYRLREPKADERGRACRKMNLLTCKLHEGRNRITKSEIQNRDRGTMTYGHDSQTYRWK
eukprot:10990584-Heterocapsa_arctica.AAC.1